jgi:hypothetical protein
MGHELQQSSHLCGLIGGGVARAPQRRLATAILLSPTQMLDLAILAAEHERLLAISYKVRTESSDLHNVQDACPLVGEGVGLPWLERLLVPSCLPSFPLPVLAWLPLSRLARLNMPT